MKYIMHRYVEQKVITIKILKHFLISQTFYAWFTKPPMNKSQFLYIYSSCFHT